VHIWSAYSPQRTWPSIIKEFLEACDALAKGDAGPMQLFVNETLGEVWEVTGERTEEHVLMQRAEAYPLGVVPTGGLVLTAGIDLQRNRWEITVWAWGRGMESWVIDHAIIEGNPASDQDWDQVYTYLQRRYPQQNHPGTLGLSAISIDSSDQTQAVYNWVRNKSAHLPTLRAIKGSSEENKPVLCSASPQVVDYRGRKWQNGIKLWLVGVDTAKDLLLGQLQISKPGPGYIHFSADLQKEWFDQLTAEQRIIVKTAGRESYKWVKRRPRNEVLDCRNYALHAAYSIGLHSYKDARWTAIEQAIQPANGDLFALPDVQPSPPATDIPQAQPKPWTTTPKSAQARAPRNW
jgi:phage terminase large subunit GpA-like protein